MTFIEALTECMNNKNVTRTSWLNCQHMFFNKNTDMFMTVLGEVFEEYMLDFEDLIATDWEIYKE